jgi:hypothetical protein
LPSSGISKSASTSAAATCSCVSFDDVAILHHLTSCRCSGQIGDNAHFFVGPTILSWEGPLNTVAGVVVKANDDTELITAASTSIRRNKRVDRMVMVVG